MFLRGRKHHDLWRRNDEKIFMMKHFVSSHRDREKGAVEFKFEIVKHLRSTFERQIFEAVEIKR